MRTAYKLIVLCGVGLLLSQFLVTPGPSFFQILIFLISSLGLVFLFIATLITGLASWRKKSRLWMYPALLCIAFILSFVTCAMVGVPSAIDNWHFKKHMAGYDKIVDSIRSGAVPCGSTITGINITNLPPGIRNILAARCLDGSMLVEFVGKGSSFAGHSGYLFKNTETNNYIADYMKRENIYLSHITGDWYRFSD
jgi:hypothetical protein